MGETSVGARQQRRIIQNAVELEIRKTFEQIQIQPNLSKEASEITVSKNTTEIQYNAGIASQVCPEILEYQFNEQMSSCSSYDDSDNDSIVSTEDHVDIIDENNVADPLEEQLRRWAVTQSITHQALDKLLLVLQHHHQKLPKSAKTLLRTPNDAPIKQLSTSEEILYTGIRNGILRKLNQKIDFTSNSLTMHFSIDGLPISGS
ncbi:unnamed protein product [Allacma fusca]|uniref:Uncharacterized protein n=1 Tax=Allacma fusca TaxID=39272 RepID=A0A8J2PDR5_9HEXA|nr:unnamed protein product [Allacma fusca]